MAIRDFDGTESILALMLRNINALLNRNHHLDRAYFQDDSTDGVGTTKHSMSPPADVAGGGRSSDVATCTPKFSINDTQV
jgi:hypothetical protein